MAMRPAEKLFAAITIGLVAYLALREKPKVQPALPRSTPRLSLYHPDFPLDEMAGDPGAEGP